MSGQRGSVLTAGVPFEESSAPAPRASVSLGQVVSAHARLTYQDWAGAPEQDLQDAYGPLVTALSDKGNPVSNYVSVGGAQPVNTTSIWSDIAHYRQGDPTFLRDVPARNAAEFQSWISSKRTSERRAAQDVMSRQSGAAQGIVGFGTDLGVGLGDPINLASMVLTGGAGATRSLLATTAREALINGAIETAELPSISHNRAQFGEDMTAGEMAGDVLTAAAGGAVFHLGAHAVAKGVKATAARFAGKADHEVVADFVSTIPEGNRTPDEEAALHVINRDTENRAASPFVDTPVGMDAHASRLDQALAAINGLNATDRASLAGSTSLSSGAVLPPPSAAQVNLSSDRVINFVMTDLEGGAKVVHYTDADGGTTKYGIAAAANPGVDVANLTRADAANIAKQKYWLPEFDRADPRAAAVAFDASYIGGQDFGRRVLAESGGDPAKALEIYREHLNHIADTVAGKEKYRKGWMNRVDKLARFVGTEGDRPLLKSDLMPDDDAGLADAQRLIDLDNADAQIRDVSDAPEIADNAAPEAPPVMEGSAVPEGRATVEALPAPEARPIETPAQPEAVTKATTTLQSFIDNSKAKNPAVYAVQDAEGNVHGWSVTKAGAQKKIDAQWEGGDFSIQRMKAEDIKAYVDRQIGPSAAPERRAAHVVAIAPPDSPEYRVMSPLGVRRVATPEAARREALTMAQRLGSPEDARAAIQKYETGDIGSFGDVTVAHGLPSDLDRQFGSAIRSFDPTRAVAMPEGQGWPSPSSLSAAAEIAINDADVKRAAIEGEAFSDPVSAAAKAQADGMAHDLRAAIDAGKMKATPFAVEGIVTNAGQQGVYQTVADILDELDAEDAAVAALKGCL